MRKIYKSFTKGEWYLGIITNCFIGGSTILIGIATSVSKELLFLIFILGILLFSVFSLYMGMANPELK